MLGRRQKWPLHQRQIFGRFTDCCSFQSVNLTRLVNGALTDIPQVECPLLHVVENLDPIQASCENCSEPHRFFPRPLVIPIFNGVRRKSHAAIFSLGARVMVPTLICLDNAKSLITRKFAGAVSGKITLRIEWASGNLGIAFWVQDPATEETGTSGVRPAFLEMTYAVAT